MSQWAKWMLTFAGLVVGALVFGFVLFAATVTRDASPSRENADAIVVLTGGEFRIREAGRLLKEGRAARMLITGVNKRTPKKDIRRIVGVDEEMFACCVDLGYEALNTRGNADETRAWARSRKYKSLIVVTSSYHMPRSLAELARELPEAHLVPHRVVPKALQRTAWWLDLKASRLLLGEYVKFLPAAANLALARTVGDWTEGALGDSGAKVKPAQL